MRWAKREEDQLIERGLEEMTKVDLEAIMQLRNRAIAMLKGASWQNDGTGNRALIRETDDLRIAYAGPFRWAAEIPAEMKHFAAAIDEYGPRPHKLTVWLKKPSRNVLNVTWNDDGQIYLVAYEPGDWEAHLA
jgi:hypothetical protein